MPEAWHQPFVPEADAVDSRRAIMVVKLVDDAPDDIVNPGAKTAARHDSGGRFRRVEEYPFARPGNFEAQRNLTQPKHFLRSGQPVVVHDSMAFAFESLRMPMTQRR